MESRYSYNYVVLQSMHVIFHLGVFNDLELMHFPDSNFNFTY